MSPQVLDYLDYRHENFVTEESDPSSMGKKVGARSFSGLSPFDVPEQVAVEVRPNRSCLLRFHYADAEKGERNPRQVLSDPDVSVVLGRRTGKVLAIELRNAMTRITDAKYVVDLRGLADWHSSESLRELQSMNADLVSAITQKALAQLQGDLLRVWAEAPTQTDSDQAAT